MDNQTIVRQLTEHAAQLHRRTGSLYRVRAYRLAAQTVQALDRPIAEIVAEGGADGLQALPGIGAHLAFTIRWLVRTGEFLTYEEGQVRGLVPTRKPRAERMPA